MLTAPIEFIYFDLDDTLLDHRHAEQQGLAEVYQEYAVHFSHTTLGELHQTYHQQSVPLWRQFAQGIISKHDVQRLRFKRTLASLNVDGLQAEALNAFYLDCYARHWTFPEPARQAFHTLADHFRVGILTNGFAEIQHAKFARFPELGDRAEVLLISEEVGFMKPHPKLFAHASAAAGASLETILYVGDSYFSDVQGARGAGWQIAWYSTQENPDTEPVFQFQDWEILLKALLDADGR